MTEWRRLANEVRGATRGSDVVTRVLVDHGVGALFGLPADSINALFDAARKQSDLRVITSRHEGGASLMASAFGKLAGSPAAVTATNGPGVTHLPVGCRDALLDGAPLIALPGALPHRQANTQAFQEVDSPVLLAPFTVSSIGVWNREGLLRLSGLVSQCGDMSAPVSASLAQDVLMESALEGRPSVIVPPENWSSRRDSIDCAVTMFRDAKRPVIVVGDVRLAPDDLLQWLQSTAVPLPVLSAPSSMHGRGWSMLAEAGRLHAGNHAAWDVLRSADLLVAVGGWPGDVLADVSAPTILLSTRPFHIAGTPPSEILLGSSWRALLSDPERPSDQRSAKVSPSDPSPAWRMLETLDEVLPANAVVSVEPGWVTDAVFAGLAERNRRFTGSFRARTEGYAVPAAVGAAVALPDQPAIAIVDARGWDEGHVEILTSLKHNLGVSVVVLASADQSLVISAQASAMGMAIVDRTRGTIERNSLLVLDGCDVSHKESDAIASLRLAATEAGRPLIVPGAQSPANDLAKDLANDRVTASAKVTLLGSAETASLYAAGLSKATGRAPILAAPDEVTLLRQYNGLFDCSHDRAGIVVVTMDGTDTAPSRWPLGQPFMLLNALPHLSLSADGITPDAVRRAGKLADDHGCVVHLRIDGPGRSHAGRHQVGLRRSVVAEPNRAAVVSIAEMLEAAQRPLFVVGAGAADSVDGVRALAARSGALMVATMGGGVGLDEDPGFVGYLGSSGHRAAQKALAAADMVVILGVSNRGAAFDTVDSRQIIDINVDRATLAHRQGRRLSVIASIEALVESLTRRLGESVSASPNALAVGWDAQPVSRRRLSQPDPSSVQAAWWTQVGISRPGRSGALRPSYVIRRLDHAARRLDRVRFTADVGLNTLFLLRYRRSHLDTLWTRNFATMGFALPAAVAAASADGVPTIAVMGDGGMGMAMGGLGALREGAPPVLAVVLDNRRLGAIRYEQELFGWPEFESGLTNGDLAGYARASGWHGVTVTDTPALEIAVDAFLTDRTPTVLHVLCTPDEAPVPAGLPNAAKTASMAYAWARQGRTGIRSAMTTIKAVSQR